MKRYEFEYEYAKKYLNGDLDPVNDNRDGEGYTDHHIDLCWKVQKLKNIYNGHDLILTLGKLEW